MTLGVGGATAAVGTTAVLVAAWGGWLSIGASRRGPGWARAHLEAWRYGPWILALAGAGAALAVVPIWVGLGILYIATVTGLLMRQVRRRLEIVEEAYGRFDSPGGAPPISRRAGAYLMGGGVVLALLGVADLLVRGWSGIFTPALAATLAVVGWVVRRQ